MTAADWVIVVVIILSVLQAAISGFFHEAFGIAGLVFGYLLAAWNYQRLAERFAPHIKSEWLGEIAAFLIIFLAVMLLAGIAGRIPLDRERSRARVLWIGFWVGRWGCCADA